MSSIPFLGALSALAASVAWGGGDFSGGFASRRHHPFQVLVLSASIGLLPLLPLTLIRGEGPPLLTTLVLATIAGAAGTLGLAAFYRGLTMGSTAVVAPVASVIGALVPLLVGLVRSGLPGSLKMLGFIAGLTGIWLVSGSSDGLSEARARDLRWGLLAGIGFGGFLTVIAQVDSSQLFMPLIISKISGMVVAGVFLMRQGMPVPAPGTNRTAMLAGLLDTAGNSFYLFGTQLTRLDVVAVLASLYPAVTVVLGRAILQEDVTPRQWSGVGVSILAIALVTQ